MSLNIRKTSILLLCGNIVAVLALLVAYLFYEEAQKEISDSYESKYLSYLLADEMRQSSDDLTRLARTYAVTGEAKYEKQYFRILDIRNGKVNRPEDYYRIYWDLYTVDEKKPRPDSNVRKSLNVLMQEAGFTEEEFALLKKAGDNSDGLVNLEVEAMNAVKGKFKDNAGQYTVSGAPNLQLAAQLTHSEDYHRFKAGIVKPIDDFYLLLEERTNHRIDDAEDASHLYGIIVLVMVVLVLIMAGLTGWIFQVRVVKPVEGIKNVMLELSNDNLEVDVTGTEQTDEIGDMARSVQTFKDGIIRSKALAEQQRLEEEKQMERSRQIEQLADRFNRDITGSLESASGASSQMENAAHSMSSTTGIAGEKCTAAASASQQANSNVNTVAAAATELETSISEINRQIATSTTIANRAEQDATTTDQQMQGLSDAVDAIGQIVALITDIADQTNLLALNATIEAARAGEAGKGFAVVASEVKNLANQTAKATEDISMQISNVQAATSGSVQAIKGIVGTISEIREITTAIAAAVEEQGAATQEIARNVVQASEGTEQLDRDVSDVSQAMNETETAAGQVLTATSALNTEMNLLREKVETFLGEIRTV